MKKILFILVLCISITLPFVYQANAAGSVVLTSASDILSDGSMRLVILTITGSASDGTVTAVSSDTIKVSQPKGYMTLTAFMKGYYIYSASVVNGSTAPTTSFNVLIKDNASIALDQALLSSLPNSSSTFKNMGLGAAGYPVVATPLTFQMTGSTVHSAFITLFLVLVR